LAGWAWGGSPSLARRVSVIGHWSLVIGHWRAGSAEGFRLCRLGASAGYWQPIRAGQRPTLRASRPGQGAPGETSACQRGYYDGGTIGTRGRGMWLNRAAFRRFWLAQSAPKNYHKQLAAQRLAPPGSTTEFPAGIFRLCGAACCFLVAWLPELWPECSP
jgi:hypothetical protein